MTLYPLLVTLAIGIWRSSSLSMSSRFLSVLTSPAVESKSGVGSKVGTLGLRGSRYFGLPEAKKIVLRGVSSSLGMSSLAEIKKRPVKNNSMKKSLKKNWTTNWAVVLDLGMISLNQ